MGAAAGGAGAGAATGGCGGGGAAATGGGGGGGGAAAVEVMVVVETMQLLNKLTKSHGKAGQHLQQHRHSTVALVRRRPAPRRAPSPDPRLRSGRGITWAAPATPPTGMPSRAARQ